MHLTSATESEEPEAEGRPSKEEIASLPADGGPESNRLIFEKSPYLLQHARNPVDWYPWGEGGSAPSCSAPSIWPGGRGTRRES